MSLFEIEHQTRQILDYALEEVWVYSDGVQSHAQGGWLPLGQPSDLF
jgi:hypothetical protein